MTPVKTSELNKLCSKFDHLKHITFPNVKQNQVCKIIGIDNLELIHYSEIVKGPKNTPWAVRTPLGWTCARKTKIFADEQNPVLKTQTFSHGQLDNEFFTKVQDWMKIKNYGIASKRKALFKNDEKALEILQSTTRFRDGHYEVGLLWKDHAKLPNNRWLAEKLLKQLKAKLSTKQVLKEKYKDTLQKDLQKGYVVKIDPCTDNIKSFSYLPLHTVSNENQPGKIRRVTNASSIFQGQSLNSNLLKDPDFLSNLVGIILRFRESHIALSTDIEQMFMQVKVAPSDRSYLRFLWDQNGKIEEYECTSHIFGATSSLCIASYALRCSAKDNQKHFPKVSHIVERNIYMDDLYISTDDVEKAVNIMSSTKACLSLGGFNLTKWNSNLGAFLQQVSRDQLLNTNEASPQIRKALRLPWNAKQDTYLIEKKLFTKFPLDNAMVTQKNFCSLLHPFLTL